MQLGESFFRTQDTACPPSSSYTTPETPLGDVRSELSAVACFARNGPEQRFAQETGRARSSAYPKTSAATSPFSGRVKLGMLLQSFEIYSGVHQAGFRNGPARGAEREWLLGSVPPLGSQGRGTGGRGQRRPRTCPRRTPSISPHDRGERNVSGRCTRERSPPSDGHGGSSCARSRPGRSGWASSPSQ